MSNQDWVKLALYVWLSAYVIYFLASCILICHTKNLGRWLIFSGTLLLLFVNLALFAIEHDIIEMAYSPYYETADWKTYMGDQPLYPEWQRYFYWISSLADVLGKILVGIGLIIEGRKQMKILRLRQMEKFQPTTHNPAH